MKSLWCWFFHRKYHHALRREGDFTLLRCGKCRVRWGMWRFQEPKWIPVKCEAE